MPTIFKIKPKVHFYELKYYLDENRLNPLTIENSAIYNLVKNLTDKVYCSFEDKYDKRWEDFYLPLKRSGKEISIPFTIVEYEKDFFCHFPRLDTLRIKRGNRKPEEIFKKIF